MSWAAMVCCLSLGPAARLCATGPSSAAAAAYDTVLRDLLATWQVPAAAVAVGYRGRLVVARGYGLSGPGEEPVQPDSRFRLASVSKPLTAVAILRLAELGRLDLDDPVLHHLAGILPAGAPADRRWEQITLRQLLRHEGGWDRDTAGDPMFKSLQISRELGLPGPADALATCRWMAGQPLQFDPGTRSVYSNFGYCLLGRVIEAVTGRGYEAAVRELLLDPLGMAQTRLGRTLRQHRAAGEVTYAAPAALPWQASVFPGEPGPLPAPYGSWCLEAMDAHGGWLSTAPDLVRFALAVDGRDDRPELLQPATRALMLQRPTRPDVATAEAWYALGWMVRPVGQDTNYWHGGSLPGTTTILVRAANGFCWAALLNSRPLEGNLGGELDRAMWRAFGQVREWPSEDLFEQL
ncbi:MAG: beta-lactamase family protein [Fimbriimonadaceae bacterium]|nr:beta-lactamase family protein [Fimbriimonadaceae bacterium]